MQLGYAKTSLILLGVSILFLVAMTLFESALAGVSQSLERIITFLTLVLPAGVGTAFAAVSLGRREGKTWMALAALILNGLFALFHLALVLFAG